MARARAAVPLALLALSAFLVSGCASPEGDDGPSTDAPTDPSTGAGAAPTPPEDAAQDPPATQEQDLAWSVAAVCLDPPPARPVVAEAYRPELDGVAFQSMAVDAATRNGDYQVTFALSPGTFAVQLVFWKGAVGPGGEVVESATDRYTQSASTVTLEGRVPAQADFATASSCGPAGSSAHYLAQALGVAALL